jgi:hypothetical protein
MPQTVGPIRRATPRSERDLDHHERQPGARCPVRANDRWHLQTLPVAVLQLLLRSGFSLPMSSLDLTPFPLPLFSVPWFRVTNY